MAIGQNLRTYFEGTWHEGDVPVMRAADHGAWLGTSVFDGARYFDGVAPDLEAHCARVNRSAEALMIEPTVSVEDMVAIVHDGLAAYPKSAAVYIRPMYWAIDGDVTAVAPATGKTGFAVCLEEIPLAPPEATATLGTTQFRRPVLESSVVNAKAGCLYPNNARMLRAAFEKGFDNAVSLDPLGNVAETATSNIWMVKDGVALTPAPNGTFLNGITRKRVLGLLRDAGIETHETTITLDQLRDADEIFSTGNAQKVMPIIRFDDREYDYGPVARKARELYWEYSHA